jgi:uncharacterized membrane protein
VVVCSQWNVGARGLLRFTVIDEFGEPIRRFATKAEAINFMSNKKGCTLVEITLESVLGECLF